MKIWGHPGIRASDVRKLVMEPGGHGPGHRHCDTALQWESTKGHWETAQGARKGEVSTGFQGAKLGRYWYILEDIDDNNLQKDGTVRFLTSPHLRKCGDTGSSSSWGYYSIWFIMTGWWFGTWILWLSIQLGMSSSQLTIRLSFFRGIGWNHQPDMG